jgi:hypothetical protein
MPSKRQQVQAFLSRFPVRLFKPEIGRLNFVEMQEWNVE